MKALTLSENRTVQICVTRTSNQTRAERIAITVQSRDGTAVGEDRECHSGSAFVGRANEIFLYMDMYSGKYTNK